jgi:hypothetical protein
MKSIRGEKNSVSISGICGPNTCFWALSSLPLLLLQLADGDAAHIYKNRKREGRSREERWGKERSGEEGKWEERRRKVKRGVVMEKCGRHGSGSEEETYPPTVPQPWAVSSLKMQVSYGLAVNPLDRRYPANSLFHSSADWIQP